jgi:hypothetical protein
MTEGKLWGATAIARFAGVSVETVYRWERLQDCPVTKPGGRYFAFRSALMTWLTAKDARLCQISPDKPVSCGVDIRNAAAAYHCDAALVPQINSRDKGRDPRES